MDRLRYFTTGALESLRETVPDRLDWYYSPEKVPSTLPVDGFRESRVGFTPFGENLRIDENRPSSTDVDNALTVYQALRDLSPLQASTERLWAYLCHLECREYVSARWLHRQPAKNEDAAREVCNHFFAVGNRALIRDNGVSRLWWLGKIAYDVAPDEPRKFLTILLHRQDVRSALIERPSVSRNPGLLRGIFRVMARHWNNGGALFKREAFRSWMVALDRRGGVILLDTLPEHTLNDLLNEEANFAIESSLKQ